MNEFKNSEIVKDKKGRQYHIGLRSNEISNKIILVGDPARAKLISSMFDKILITKENREYLTFTGICNGINLTVMSTGMGTDNTEIAIIELCQLKFPLTIIRCGSCGALQKNINIGDVVISSGALRLENTTSFFVENNYPAIASYEVSIALLKASSDEKINYHFGITATAPGFYGAQCRHIKGFPLRDEGLLDRLIKQGVKNLEMETSALLTLANLRGFRAGSICTVFASRIKNKFIDPENKIEAEKKVIKVCLSAFKILKVMDKQKGKNNFWLPDINI